MSVFIQKTVGIPPSLLCDEQLPFAVSESHCIRSLKAIQNGGGEVTTFDGWLYFQIGDPILDLDIASYEAAAKQWKILLNPQREYFYAVLERAVRALANSGVDVGGKVIGADVGRKSGLSVLDDPCEPKILFYVSEATPFRAKEKFISTISSLESEFSPNEHEDFGCSEGLRERFGTTVPQWGPSFTKMRTPLIFYQQGGYIESERYKIIESEAEREKNGLQSAAITARRVSEKMGKFFTDQNFSLYAGTADPLSLPVRLDLRKKELKNEATTISEEVAALPDNVSSWGNSCFVSDAIKTIERFSSLLLTAHKVFFQEEFERTVAMRKLGIQKIRALRVIIKKEPMSRLQQAFLATINDFLHWHPCLKQIHSFKDFLKKSMESSTSLSTASKKTLLRRFRDHLTMVSQEVQGINAVPLLRSRQLLWVSGSTTSSLPGIFNSSKALPPALVPTGELLQENTAPFSGQLDEGICACGVNLRCLSGSLMASPEIPLMYAHQHFSLNCAEEMMFLQSITPKNVFQKIIRAKIAALRLKHLGKESSEDIIRRLQQVRGSLPETVSVKKDWERFLPLLGKKVPLENYPVLTELQVGKMVATRWFDGVYCMFLVIGMTATEEFRLCGVDPVSQEMFQISVCHNKSPRVIPLSEKAVSMLLEQNLPSRDRKEGILASVNRFLRRLKVNDTALFDECARTFHLLGKQAPPFLLLSNQIFIPGEIVGFPGEDRTFEYAIVTGVHEGKVFVMDRLQKNRQMLPIDLLSFSDNFLEGLLKHDLGFEDTEILQLRVAYAMRSCGEALDEIIHILQTEKPRNFTEIEREFIQKPSPIVWGSFTAAPMLIGNLHLEAVVHGRQLLGRDIQVMFAEDEKIEVLQSYVNEHMPRGTFLPVLPLSTFKRWR